MRMRISVCWLVLVCGMICAAKPLMGQRYDSTIIVNGKEKTAQVYLVGSQGLVYAPVKGYHFITRIPATFRDAAKESFSRKSLPAWGAIVASSAILIWQDQNITNQVRSLCSDIGLDRTEVYKDALYVHAGGKKLDIYQIPQNLNTGIYQLGEGLPPLLISAGLLTYGLAKHDLRATSTASQAVQAMLMMGITTQLLKRLSGRESPESSTADGGIWRPFGSWSAYAKKVSAHDAFPSGHMGTMMAAVTVFADNYPEKRWIRPVGYGIMGLCGLAMINNGVHWAGDYPFAIGLGYVSAKVTVKMNRWVKGTGKIR